MLRRMLKLVRGQPAPLQRYLPSVQRCLMEISNSRLAQKVEKPNDYTSRVDITSYSPLGYKFYKLPIVYIQGWLLGKGDIFLSLVSRTAKDIKAKLSGNVKGSVK